MSCSSKMKLLVILAFVLCISVGEHSSSTTLFWDKVYPMDRKSAATGSNIYRQPSIVMISYIVDGLRSSTWLNRTSFVEFPLVYNEFAEFFLSPISTLYVSEYYFMARFSQPVVVVAVSQLLNLSWIFLLEGQIHVPIAFDVADNWSVVVSCN